MISHARRNPARLASAPRPDARITASKRSRPKGSASLAAIAPSMTALTTVPAARAAASMSNAASLRLCRRAMSSSTDES